MQERPGDPSIHPQWNSDLEAKMAFLEGLGRGCARCCHYIHPCQDGLMKGRGSRTRQTYVRQTDGSGQQRSRLFLLSTLHCEDSAFSRA